MKCMTTSKTQVQKPRQSITSDLHQSGLRIVHTLKQPSTHYEENANRHDRKLLISAGHKRNLTKNQRSDDR